MRVLSAFLTALFLVSTLAGCVGGGATPESDSSAAPIGVGAPDGDAAALDVLLTDDSFAPVSGASVGLLESKAETTTDEAGRASFFGITPGTHTVFVQKLGYESVGKKLDLAAGDRVEITIQMLQIEVVTAYHLTYIFRGHITCGAGLIQVRLITVCGTTGTGTAAGNVTVDPNHKDEFRQTGLPGTQTIVGELEWASSAPLAAKEFTLALYQNWRCTPFCSADNTYGAATGKSPVVHRAEGPFAGLKKGPATISHVVGLPGQSQDPPFAILVFQQDYSIYSTHFFGEAAPEAFTANPDG